VDYHKSISSEKDQMGDEEFAIRAAKTPKEACQLPEVDFDYVDTIHGEEIFRKRK
jgi:hypothetical protein